MKAFLFTLLKVLVEYLVKRFLNKKQATDAEEKPSYENDIRTMDKAIVDGDADSVTLMFDRLSDGVPPDAGSHCSNPGTCRGCSCDSGGQNNTATPEREL